MLYLKSWFFSLHCHIVLKEALIIYLFVLRVLCLEHIYRNRHKWEELKTFFKDSEIREYRSGHPTVRTAMGISALDLVTVRYLLHKSSSTFFFLPEFGVNTQKCIDPKIIYPKWLDKRQGNEAENMLAKGLIHTVHRHTHKKKSLRKETEQPTLLFLKLKRNKGVIAGTTKL